MSKRWGYDDEDIDLEMLDEPHKTELEHILQMVRTWDVESKTSLARICDVSFDLLHEIKDLDTSRSIFRSASDKYDKIKRLLDRVHKRTALLEVVRSDTKSHMSKMIQPESCIAVNDESLFLLESIETINQQSEAVHNVVRGISEVYAHIYTTKSAKSPRAFSPKMLNEMYENTVKILGSAHSASMTLEKIQKRKKDADIENIIIEFSEAMIPFTAMNLLSDTKDAAIWSRALGNQENIVGTSPFVDVVNAATADPMSKAGFITELVKSMNSASTIEYVSAVETASILVGGVAYSTLCAINLASDRSAVDSVLYNEVSYGKSIDKFLAEHGERRPSNTSIYLKMAQDTFVFIGIKKQLQGIYVVFKGLVEAELMASSADILRSFTYKP